MTLHGANHDSFKGYVFRQRKGSNGRETAERDSPSFLGLVGGRWSAAVVPELEAGVSGFTKFTFLEAAGPAPGSTESQRSSGLSWFT